MQHIIVQIPWMEAELYVPARIINGRLVWLDDDGNLRHDELIDESHPALLSGPAFRRLQADGVYRFGSGEDDRVGIDWSCVSFLWDVFNGDHIERNDESARKLGWTDGKQLYHDGHAARDALAFMQASTDEEIVKRTGVTRLHLMRCIIATLYAVSEPSDAMSSDLHREIWEVLRIRKEPLPEGSPVQLMPHSEALGRRARRFTKEGSYPLFYLRADDEVSCPDCAMEDPSDIYMPAQVNWENPSLTCGRCEGVIPSAYADDDEGALYYDL